MPDARWRCAHCVDRITGWGRTWFGPVPQRGQDPEAVPCYHLAQEECRVVGGQPPRTPNKP